MVDAALVAYVTFNVPYKQRSADSRSCQVGLTASTHRCEVGSVDPSVCQLLFANVVMLFWIIMPFILIAVPAALLAMAIHNYKRHRDRSIRHDCWLVLYNLCMLIGCTLVQRIVGPIRGC